MIKILIVEDEIPAQVNLKKLIDRCCPDGNVVMTLTSVRQAVKWLEENPEGADVIFMDVELSDGICFEIFERVNINAHVIITTAYDNYAINAFKVNSRDYLLKPIGDEDMKRAWERCRESIESRASANIETLLDMVSRANGARGKEYKKRFIVKTGEKIIIIPVEDIAYCCEPQWHPPIVGLLVGYGAGDARPEALLPHLAQLYSLDKRHREYLEAPRHAPQDATQPTYGGGGGCEPQPHFRLLGVAR